MIPRKPALGFIFVTVTLDILGIGLIIPILPRLVESFEHGNAAAASHTVGLLTSLYALMQFLCAPLLGSLSDRFGRRPVILASLLGSGLDYFLLAVAPNLGWFFAGRIIAGITGANFAAATAYIADISPPEKRAANFGIIGAAFGVGFIAGPAVGGLLGDVGLRVLSSWRAVSPCSTGSMACSCFPSHWPPGTGAPFAGGGPTRSARCWICVVIRWRLA